MCKILYSFINQPMIKETYISKLFEHTPTVSALFMAASRKHIKYSLLFSISSFVVLLTKKGHLLLKENKYSFKDKRVYCNVGKQLPM